MPLFDTSRATSWYMTIRSAGVGYWLHPSAVPCHSVQRTSDPGSECVRVRVVPNCIIKLNVVQSKFIEVVRSSCGACSLNRRGDSVAQPWPLSVYPINDRAHSDFFGVGHSPSQEHSIQGFQLVWHCSDDFCPGVSLVPCMPVELVSVLSVPVHEGLCVVLDC